MIALACSPALEGHDHWTLRLLAGKVVEAGSPVPAEAFRPIPAVSAAPSAPGPSWAGNVPVSAPSPSGRRLRDGGQVPEGHHPHAAYVHLDTVATQLAPVLVAPSGTGIIVEMQPAGPLAGDVAQRTITGEGLCAGAGPGRGAIGHDHDVLGPLAQHPAALDTPPAVAMESGHPHTPRTAPGGSSASCPGIPDRQTSAGPSAPTPPRASGLPALLCHITTELFRVSLGQQAWR